MSKRPGTGWEETVREDFPMLRPTSNSGARDGDGDLRHARFLVECKDEAGDAIKFPYAQLVKLRAEAHNHLKRHWLRFFRNGRGDKVVSMDYELAQTLLWFACSEWECGSCGAKSTIDW